MRAFFTLLNREIRSYFYQPIAYVVMFFLLMVAGFNFYMGVMALMGRTVEYTIVEVSFLSLLFWIAFIFTFPLITMRTFSEEYRMGTIETLTTAPVSDWNVVLSKFFGVLLFYIVLWVPTFIHFGVFKLVAETEAAQASGAFGSVYLLLLLMGMFFCAIGCFTSSLVKEQINAAVICACSILIWFFLPFVPSMMGITRPDVLELFRYFSCYEHMIEFSRGMIDSRQIVWYLSATAVLLVLTLHSFQRRKWRA